MYKTFLLLIIFGLLIQTNLHCQIFSGRELLLKNKVSEIKKSLIHNSDKILTNIYYINDSGLVEKEISLEIDSLGIYDTSYVSTYAYDSQNRKVLEFSTSKEYSRYNKTYYIDDRTSLDTMWINKLSDSTFITATITKHSQRNNLSVYKSYKGSHWVLTERFRTYKHKIVIRRKKLTKNSHSHYIFLSPMTKYVSILDDSKKRVKEYATFKTSFFSKKHALSIFTYKDELLDKVCYNMLIEIPKWYIYEYKTGIKLNEK